jgi:aspartokinase/homoserine dehydrogenase 1
LGAGGVGKALLRQVLDQRSYHAERYGLRLALCAVADSSAFVQADASQPNAELDDATLEQLLTLKASGAHFAQHRLAQSVSDPLQVVKACGVQRNEGLATVVVDCTATEKTVPALLIGLEQGCKLVLANKKPLTIDQEVYDRLTSAGDTVRANSVRWETTCGAALPIIVTLQRLLACGDTPRCIAGAFSGTLGYVMSGLQAGRKFSEVVGEAHRLGYTEPDPRDDLGGMDVARKALILARGLGWKLEMSDVQVSGLYPLSMDGIPVANFLKATSSLDAYFAGQVEAAAAEGKVLRYAATVENGQCKVGPTLVSLNSPLGRLTGSDNLVEISTRWYTPNPLVVQGRGAGVEITASGVLADVVDLAYTN